VTDSEDKPRGFRTFLQHLNNSDHHCSLLSISTVLVTRHSFHRRSSYPELLCRDNSSSNNSSRASLGCQLQGRGVVCLIRLSRGSTLATGRMLAGNKTRIPTSVINPDPVHRQQSTTFLPSNLNNLHDQFRFLSPRPSRQHQDQTLDCFYLAEKEAS